ncbi:MAG: hypothetical protein UU22_C0003G0014 [Parcubacteria group bacterium GW2011_GWA2_40_8]|nr:MAG: hypothetical protein UT82_C0017G0010 [Parcubacteria group bacterium GW2011_GWB1_40_14]KKR79131.1 MAG: hypothetical protein UU22_C0003G0014 [Parcubacteria group bacterium GW2011_GWA2_40_8]
MQTAFKIIIISVIIAIASYGVGLVLKGNGGQSGGNSKTTVSGSGILYSEDSGDTWTQRANVVSGQNISKYNITEIAIHPVNTDIIFAGTDSGGLYRSKDASSSWEAVSDKNNILLPRSMVRAIALDREDPKRFFIAVFQDSKGRILRSEDQGESFQEMYFTSKDKIGVNDVVLSPLNKNQIFIGTDDGLILESSDGGFSWRTIGRFTSPIHKLAQTSGGVLLAVVKNKGLLRSSDLGANWLESQDTLNGKRLQSFSGANSIEYMVIDPQNAANIYLGTAYGLLRSIDGGISFTAPPLVIPPQSLPVMSIGIDPHNSNIIFVGAGQAVYRSEDGGEHWSVHAVPTNKRLRVMSVFPNSSNKILIGVGK